MWQYSICFFAAAIVAAIFDLDGLGSVAVRAWLGLALIMLAVSALSKLLFREAPAAVAMPGRPAVGRSHYA